MAKTLVNKATSIEEDFKSISDETLKIFTKSALSDAKKFLSSENNNLQDLSYLFYRAYVLGFMMDKVTAETKANATILMAKKSKLMSIRKNHLSVVR